VLIPLVLTWGLKSLVVWPKEQVMLALYLASNGAWLVGFLVFLRRYGSAFWTGVGLRSSQESWRNQIGLGVFCGTCILVFGTILGFLAQVYRWEVTQPYQAVPPWKLEWLVVLAIVLAPLMEELIFRGLLQSTLYRYMPRWAAVGVTVAVFTLFHTLYLGNWLAMVYVLVTATILGVFRDRTRALLPGMIGHLINNALAAGALLHR
jgi:membrane protease YdiL (CAAX protease family)